MELAPMLGLLVQLVWHYQQLVVVGIDRLIVKLAGMLYAHTREPRRTSSSGVSVFSTHNPDSLGGRIESCSTEGQERRRVMPERRAPRPSLKKYLYGCQRVCRIHDREQNGPRQPLWDFAVVAVLVIPRHRRSRIGSVRLQPPCLKRLPSFAALNHAPQRRGEERTQGVQSVVSFMP